MKSTTAAVIALGALATVVPACAQESHSHSHSHSSECTAEFLTSAKSACDSVADVSQLKCDDEGCHEALHSLVEDEVRQCYVDLGLGPATDLDYYVQLDEFCHGDGADPADLAATSNTTASSSGSGAGAATCRSVAERIDGGTSSGGSHRCGVAPVGILRLKRPTKLSRTNA
ncbi:hypothetical protein PHYSODRAFT_306065 [Phytophthora sojae]|uniref:Elicitin-like protein n=1 Tax=Phytophthora sojae (strain P6497) TaxID=1094619 RepID=G5A7P9_PHYSP|nr:hypothetical protein PHYSODRAFT_306065 [Phytophthora sojae]EGZ07925.1 hypothetical protein PHYSODRAFT_306065 [Phytophthora sojae]|eukprot:XP_009536097.1 hypothetical protein PHYSODRAFT_306065 [Phytophthora sojae]